jgi:hypothetical protein
MALVSYDQHREIISAQPKIIEQVHHFQAYDDHVQACHVSP